MTETEQLTKKIEMLSHLIASKDCQIRAMQIEVELVLADKDKEIADLKSRLEDAKPQEIAQ